MLALNEYHIIQEVENRFSFIYQYGMTRYSTTLKNNTSLA